MPSIGPQLPPHLRPEPDATVNTTTTNKDPDSPNPASPFGPSLPKHDDSVTTNPPKITTTSKKPSSPPGPSLPPPSGPIPPPTHDSDSDSDSDDDDDNYGPTLPTGNNTTYISPFDAPSHKTKDSTIPKRDDWMLAPPSGPSKSSSNTAPDPSTLRARKFASGPRANTTASTPGGPSELSSLWTETAAEKQKRLADAVLGRSVVPSANTGNTPAAASEREVRQKDGELKKKLEESRGPSLLASHQHTHKKRIREADEADDPSLRGWDREKDMSVGLGAGGTKRSKNEAMRKAKEFGGRFGGGKFL